MKIMNVLVTLLLSLTSAQAFAVTIEFPEEELAQESVLPIFDNTVAVKSRLVPTAKRFEFGFGGGFLMNEPFFETSRFGGHMAYHFTETHGIILQGQMYTQGLGANGRSLANQNLSIEEGQVSFVRMQYAPQPKHHFSANYQITPYYGKMSLFKDMVMNLSLYGLAGVGMIDIGGESTPMFNVGLGQKFYFSKRWGIRTDLSLLAYQGVNYFRGSDGGSTPLQDTGPGFEAVQRVPGDFERRTNYDMQMTISVIILI
jgi:outer membrane beta-barrel protein